MHSCPYGSLEQAASMSLRMVLASSANKPALELNVAHWPGFAHSNPFHDSPAWHRFPAMQALPFQYSFSKVPEPDLRRRICTNGACKEPEPNPGEADLRRRICPNGSCKECPPGQSAGKNGNCVTTPAPPRTASACQANESWNGSICTGAASACQPNEY